ncbi:prolyl-tRNA synthetase associated domain-containing protein [Streptococcus massiliensis]|uniref:FIG042921: similarity to aminoacyl-tRNA editing enzymes YbaK, ProX n=1 Tax=Streptococcus massiliensis TaxID=313439 RepID=A0A380KYZ6_9STRE|nr:prolyl-tRNA synthetase associated domain-containing protein [Streptococcus massiliensis]SUN76948.1 FIG042921: similarity to aminoacyl-tRNA editing enzymes YbaK, ProX [Streptococcus massiliensis]
MTNEEWIYAKLDELGIAYDRLDHEPIYSVIEAAEKGIVLPGCQVKNLLLKNKKGRQFYLVILPDEKIADIKHLAEVLGEKRLSFASDENLTELMQVEAGSVTPFGLVFDKEKKVQVIIDESVDVDAKVGFHPFVNTTTLNIAYPDLLRFLKWAEHEPQRLNC